MIDEMVNPVAAQQPEGTGGVGEEGSRLASRRCRHRDGFEPAVPVNPPTAEILMKLPEVALRIDRQRVERVPRRKGGGVGRIAGRPGRQQGRRSRCRQVAAFADHGARFSRQPQAAARIGRQACDGRIRQAFEPLEARAVKAGGTRWRADPQAPVRRLSQCGDASVRQAILDVPRLDLELRRLRAAPHPSRPAENHRQRPGERGDGSAQHVWPA